MQFDVYRQSDGRLLVVPVVFIPSAFVEEGKRPQLVGHVTVDPSCLSSRFIRAIGRDGCAVPDADDAVWFDQGFAFCDDLSAGGQPR